MIENGKYRAGRPPVGSRAARAWRWTGCWRTGAIGAILPWPPHVRAREQLRHAARVATNSGRLRGREHFFYQMRKRPAQNDRRPVASRPAIGPGSLCRDGHRFDGP